MKGYLGKKGQSGVYQTIIALMPPHDTYIEPFAGSGLVLRRKPPAARSIAIDLNRDAVKSLQGLPGVEAAEGDAFALLSARAFPQKAMGRVLLYVDPPYVHATRTSRHRYAHELTDADHKRLCRLLRRAAGRGASVILSGYPNSIYDTHLGDWNTKEYQTMTRGGVRTEKLWFNFDPTAAHWATYAGENFTDRQRIKRKAARWAEQFKALPPGERQAVLAAILSADTRPT